MPFSVPELRTCSLACCGANGTALTICCNGPAGEEGTSFMRYAATTGNADRPCRSSIYNCSTKNLLKK